MTEKNRLRSQIAALSISALAALGLFHVRDCLTDLRISIAEREASRDHVWDNYLLAERRSSTAAILIDEGTRFGVKAAVAHLRGEANAVAAAGAVISQDVWRVLGVPNLTPLQSPLGQELVRKQYTRYRALRQAINGLQGELLESVNAQGAEIRKLRRQIGPLTGWETLLFVLTVLGALMTNVLGALRK